MLFTDYYAEQSCTAGRAAFIMGQSVFRTGLSKVGLPGAALGMRAEDPTIAEDYPNFRENFGPRGVLHCFANPDGTQKIEDTGPLTKKRVETIEDDIVGRAIGYSTSCRFKAMRTPFTSTCPLSKSS